MVCAWVHKAVLCHEEAVQRLHCNLSVRLRPPLVHDVVHAAHIVHVHGLHRLVIYREEVLHGAARAKKVME